jgi:hypothetical protein
LDYNTELIVCFQLAVLQAAPIELEFGQRSRPLRKSLDLLSDNQSIPTLARRKMPRQHSAFLNNPFISSITSPVGSSIQSVFKPGQLMVSVNVPFIGNPFLSPLVGAQSTTTKKPMLANPYPGNPFLSSSAQKPMTVAPTTTTTSVKPTEVNPLPQKPITTVAPTTTSSTLKPMPINPFPGNPFLNGMAPSTTTTTTAAPKPDLDNIFFFGDYSTPDSKKAESTTSTTPIPQSEIESIFFFGDSPKTSTTPAGYDDANKVITGAFDFVNYMPPVTTAKSSQVSLTDEALNGFFDFSKELETTTVDDENTTGLLDDRINPNVIKSLVG